MKLLTIDQGAGNPGVLLEGEMSSIFRSCLKDCCQMDGDPNPSERFSNGGTKALTLSEG